MNHCAFCKNEEDCPDAEHLQWCDGYVRKPFKSDIGITETEKRLIHDNGVLNDKLALLRNALKVVVNELEQWNLTEGEPEAIAAMKIGRAALDT